MLQTGFIDFPDNHKRDIWYNEKLSDGRQVKSIGLHFSCYMMCKLIQLQLYLNCEYDNNVNFEGVRFNCAQR